MDEWATCDLCNSLIKKKNLKKHQNKVHGKKRADDSFKTKRVADLSPADKRKRLKLLFGPDEYRKSDDALSGGRMVHGGAFGLGKNRKH